MRSGEPSRISLRKRWISPSLGTLTGSIIGAAFLSSLPELMRDFSTYRMLAYSVVLVLVMLFRPGGIFGRWEFSLTRLLDGIRHPKAKAAKGA